MATRVYAWDANPSVDRFFYKLSVRRAQSEILDTFQGFKIKLPDGRMAVQLYPPVEVEQERGARNAVLVLARKTDPLQHPPRLHYAVPAVCDHRLRWQQHFLSQPNKMPPLTQ